MMSAAPNAGDLIDFVPDPSQMARLAVTGTPAGAPPVWVAMAAIGAALGLSLSLALPPATTVRRGAVTAGVSTAATDETATDDAIDDKTPRQFELFQLPAWHDESTVTTAAREASAGDSVPHDATASAAAGQ